MDPADSYWVSEFDGVTTVHPIAVALVLACGIAMLVLPRRYATWPLFVVACFVAPAQRVVVFGLNFKFLRLMVLFGTMRVLLAGEWTAFRWCLVDRLMLAWGISKTILYTMLHGTTAALVFQLGATY